MFTLTSCQELMQKEKRLGSGLDDGNEGVCKEHEERDTDADHGDRIKQTGNDEHLDLESRNHFRLASRAFEEAPTQQTKSDSGTESTRPAQDGDGDGCLLYPPRCVYETGSERRRTRHRTAHR